VKWTALSTTLVGYRLHVGCEAFSSIRHRLRARAELSQAGKLTASEQTVSTRSTMRVAAFSGSCEGVTAWMRDSFEERSRGEKSEGREEESYD
jgi:hypothetical protein